MNGLRQCTIVLSLLTASSVPGQAPIRLPADPLRALEALPQQKSPTTGRLVRVVDGLGRPRSGISLVVADISGEGRKRSIAIGEETRKTVPRDRRRERLNFLALEGKRFVTDTLGEALVPAYERGLVGAVDPDWVQLRGWVNKKNQPSPVTVVRWAPRRKGVHIRVLDHESDPVRSMGWIIASDPTLGTWAGLSAAKLTGSDGRLAFDFEDWSEGIALSTIDDPFVSHMTRYVALQPDQVPNPYDRPIEIRIPPCGQIIVRVVGEDGKPYAPTRERLEVHLKGEKGPWGTAPVGPGGQAVFRRVQTGLRFSVYGKVDDRVVVGETIESVAGPTKPDEVRTLVLKGVRAPQQAKVQVLDILGKPVRSERLGILLVAESGAYRGQEARTKNDGSLVVPAIGTFRNGRGRCILTRRGTGLQPRSSARFDLQTAIQSKGSTKVRLRSAGPLLSGFAVDTSGQPVANMDLQLEDSLAGYARQGLLREAKKFMTRVTKTDKDGKFEFLDLDTGTPETEFSIRVYQRKKLWVVSGAEVLADDTGHRLIVGPPGDLLGSFKGLRDGDADRFNVYLQRKGETSKRIVHLEPDGSLRVPGTRASKYHVSIGMPGVGEIFFSAPDVVVRSGAESTDPRLRNVDLRELMRRINLTVRGTDGEPLVGARVFALWKRKNGEDMIDSYTSRRRGLVPLLGQLDGLNFVVDGIDGRHQRQVFRNQREDLTVQLKPGWRVTCAVQGLSTLPVEASISGTLTRAATGDPLADAHCERAVKLSPRGNEITLFAGAPGAYELKLEVYDPTLWTTVPGTQFAIKFEVPKNHPTEKAIAVRAALPAAVLKALDTAKEKR